MTSFLDLCKDGKLYEAQLMYESNNINIHDNNEEVFRVVCENGYIHVAQWLYSLGNN